MSNKIDGDEAFITAVQSLGKIGLNERTLHKAEEALFALLYEERGKIGVIFSGADEDEKKSAVAQIFAEAVCATRKTNRKASVDHIKINDILSEYVGGTAVNVRRFLKEAKGSVIFVDDVDIFLTVAYQRQAEAFAGLMKATERRDVKLIFNDKTGDFGKSVNSENPDLQKRLAAAVPFS